jgi:L-lactate dehydrogenase complex protein LldE
MKVSLFVTCLVDQMWTSIGVSSVEVLRRVGCQVEFDKRQTCCAQPAFNTGYLEEARAVAKRFINIFEQSKADAIVSPSGSCTTMVHHYPQLFAGVGFAPNPPVFLKTGDQMQVLIEGMGGLGNPVVSEKNF